MMRTIIWNLNVYSYTILQFLIMISLEYYYLSIILFFLKSILSLKTNLSASLVNILQYGQYPAVDLAFDCPLSDGCFCTIEVNVGDGQFSRVSCD